MGMGELVHADIFFFVTTVAVMVVATILAIALVYAIGILRDVRAIVRRMRQASESLESDFNALRHSVQQKGAKAHMLVDMVLGFVSRHLAKSSARPKRATRVVKKEE